MSLKKLSLSVVVNHNKKAWNRYVQKNNQWTRPVSSKVIGAARNGRWQVLLTPVKPVPRNWFSPLTGLRVLCLACGGGQQAPILAAAGAEVTVLDNSPRQLAQDRMVAKKNRLKLEIVKKSMTDLSCFADSSFDLVFNPVSNTFIPNVLPVWKEVARILKPEGILMAGFINPFVYIFDGKLWENGILKVRNKLPHCSLDELNKEQKTTFLKEKKAIEFSHTLEEQVGGQIKVGFVIDGFYEDINPNDIFAKYAPSYIATRARKTN